MVSNPVAPTSIPADSTSRQGSVQLDVLAQQASSSQEQDNNETEAFVRPRLHKRHSSGWSTHRLSSTFDRIRSNVTDLSKPKSRPTSWILPGRKASTDLQGFETTPQEDIKEESLPATGPQGSPQEQPGPSWANVWEREAPASAIPAAFHTRLGVLPSPATESFRDNQSLISRTPAGASSLRKASLTSHAPSLEDQAVDRQQTAPPSSLVKALAAESLSRRGSLPPLDDARILEGEAVPKSIATTEGSEMPTGEVAKEEHELPTEFAPAGVDAAREESDHFDSNRLEAPSVFGRPNSATSQHRRNMTEASEISLASDGVIEQSEAIEMVHTNRPQRLTILPRSRAPSLNEDAKTPTTVVAHDQDARSDADKQDQPGNDAGLASQPYEAQAAPLLADDSLEAQKFPATDEAHLSETIRHEASDDKVAAFSSPVEPSAPHEVTQHCEAALEALQSDSFEPASYAPDFHEPANAQEVSKQHDSQQWTHSGVHEEHWYPERTAISPVYDDSGEQAHVERSMSLSDALAMPHPGQGAQRPRLDEYSAHAHGYDAERRFSYGADEALNAAQQSFIQNGMRSTSQPVAVLSKVPPAPAARYQPTPRAVSDQQGDARGRLTKKDKRMSFQRTSTGTSNISSPASSPTMEKKKRFSGFSSLFSRSSSSSSQAATGPKRNRLSKVGPSMSSPREEPSAVMPPIEQPIASVPNTQPRSRTPLSRHSSLGASPVLATGWAQPTVPSIEPTRRLHSATRSAPGQRYSIASDGDYQPLDAVVRDRSRWDAVDRSDSASNLAVAMSPPPLHGWSGDGRQSNRHSTAWSGSAGSWQAIGEDTGREEESIYAPASRAASAQPEHESGAGSRRPSYDVRQASGPSSLYPSAQESRRSSGGENLAPAAGRPRALSARSIPWDDEPTGQAVQQGAGRPADEEMVGRGRGRSMPWSDDGEGQRWV